jgi:folate-binding protein YgfZ
VTALALHDYHQSQGARFLDVHEMEIVSDYGDALAEHSALRGSAGALDLSFRSRLCLTGADRQRFLNGQVTNNVRDLNVGEGCYAVLVTAKGRLQSDLNIYCLAQELLLDFEPGLSARIAGALEKYIIADDVQVLDAAPHYGLLSVQGPKSGEVLNQLGLGLSLPNQRMTFSRVSESAFGEIYCMNQPRSQGPGYDLFVPAAGLGAVADRLFSASKAVGGRACGWQALETARIEAGVPRFGADMDETNLAPEAGIEQRAISYTKGCYIGQEVVARIRTYGQVAKSLRGLLLPDDLPALPPKGEKLFHGDKEVGYITSAVASPAFRRNIALGYARRECNQPGTKLELRSVSGTHAVVVVELPFHFQSPGQPAPPHS